MTAYNRTRQSFITHGVSIETQESTVNALVLFYGMSFDAAQSLVDEVIADLKRTHRTMFNPPRGFGATAKYSMVPSVG